MVSHSTTVADADDTMTEFTEAGSLTIPNRRSSRSSHPMERSGSSLSQNSNSSNSNSFVSAQSPLDTRSSTPNILKKLTTQSGEREEDDDDEEMMYLRRTHTFTTLVPMKVASTVVPFDELPAEAKADPTKIMTWARMSQENLHLETILPPSCKVCLQALEARVAEENKVVDMSQYKKDLSPAIPFSRAPVDPPALRVNHGLAL
jgi:hypothetical protein